MYRHRPQTVGNVRLQRFGFDGYSVDVFVETFEQVPQKLLRILLIVTHEPRCEFLDLSYHRYNKNQ